MLSPVTSASRKANTHANRMAAKNDGSDMPSTEKKSDTLSNHVSLKIAHSTPMKMPTRMAKMMETTASSAVFGKASASISITGRLV